MIHCWRWEVKEVRVVYMIYFFLSLSLTGIAILDLGFQILHAQYSMEKFLGEFVQRSAVFEIAFWSGKSLRII